jgi:dihydrofolate reductase
VGAGDLAVEVELAELAGVAVDPVMTRTLGLGEKFRRDVDLAVPCSTRQQQAGPDRPATATDVKETVMRKITSGLFISLDGVIEEPNEWIGPWFSPQLGQAVGSMIAAQDAMLLGRVTYDEFAAHWPHQDGEMADTMNGTAKYVVSGSLTSAGWQNSTLIPAPAASAEITALKQQPGRNIGITGSATLVGSLLREGLLDELHLFVFPVVLGSGKQLFAAPGDKLPLTLTGSATFETGVVHLTYAKA